MKNPYEILEINENATEEEIKQAYRRLAKKYHPDQYGDNPLKDLAEEKMRELNEAYDSLIKNHENTSFSSSFNEIRMHINKGNISYAEAQLTNMTNHNAEWNYLMGLINLKKGWYDAGLNYISIACNLDPYNKEYTNTLNMIKNTNNTFRQGYNNTRRSDSNFCDLCVKLWCLDTMCECCCNGDIITCC